MKRNLLFVSFIILAILFTGCSFKDYNSAYKDEEGYSNYISNSKTGCKDMNSFGLVSNLEDEKSQEYYKKNSRVCGDYLITNYLDGVCINRYLGHNNTIKIPKTLDNKPVIMLGEFISDEKYNGKNQIYGAFAGIKDCKITIPSTVKTIGIRSFYGTKISKITVPSKTKTIGQGAFGSCKSLKTIVMPGDFKLKLEEDTDDKLWYVTSDQSAVDTITFNTKLKLANVSYLSANNLVVAKNDPSYQSIEGVIYTKDGKGIVRVPQKRTELKIKEGCTEFNMQSVLYNSTDSEGDEFNNCSKLKKIVIPSSVKSINKIKYKTDRADACDMHVDTIEIAPKDFDANSLYALGSSLGKNITIESLMKLLPDQITYKDHMYITKDHGLLKYDGKDANVEIPEEITWIAPEAFYRNETLKNVKLPSKITTIEENTFYGCSELEAVAIPDQVTMIGKSAFDECTVLKSVTFGKSLKVIKDQAFASVNIRNFTIPSGIQKIETGAFAGINQIGTVTFEGSTKYVAADAFMNSTGIKLVYKKGIKEAQTELSYDYIIARKNGNNKVRTTWQPVSGANGYQLKFSTDKKFKKVLKTVMVKKNVSNATTYVKNKKKTLYIKVRPYQTINKKNVYGRWSYLQL